MRIATWNVNSIRTRIDQVKDWIKEEKPDLLCLQETKVDDPLFPLDEIRSIGYDVTFHGQKSYNGVAIISKIKIEDIRKGLCGELKNDQRAIKLSEEKRVISVLADGIRVVNVYVPNGSSISSEKYNYKLEWLSCLKDYIKSQSKRSEPLCILGDFNIALEARDIHDPKRLTGGIMASEKERVALKSVLGKELLDAFRVFEPESNHWSWWDYRSRGWERDKGWRIDHIYLSNELIAQTNSCFIHKKVRNNERPSDHAPVSVDIVWPPYEEADEEEILF